SPGALGPERAGAYGDGTHTVRGIVAGLALLPAVRLRHDASPGPPRQPTLPLLHLLRRPAPGLAHLPVQVVACHGPRTLRLRTARFWYAGRPGSSTTAGI